MHPHAANDYMCHTHVADDWADNAWQYGPTEETYVVTGWARGHGRVWVAHSWMLADFGIEEPCTDEYTEYLGVVLTGAEYEDFEEDPMALRAQLGMHGTTWGVS